MFYTATLQLESLRGNETAVGEMDVLYCNVVAGKLEGNKTAVGEMDVLYCNIAAGKLEGE